MSGRSFFNSLIRASTWSQGGIGGSSVDRNLVSSNVHGGNTFGGNESAHAVCTHGSTNRFSTFNVATHGRTPYAINFGVRVPSRWAHPSLRQEPEAQTIRSYDRGAQQSRTMSALRDAWSDRVARRHSWFRPCVLRSIRGTRWGASLCGTLAFHHVPPDPNADHTRNGSDLLQVRD